MLEIEVKYRVPDWDRVRAKLAAWGAAADPVRTDADHYFNAPDRDFAATDEAVRLRRIGPDNRFTYKGPKVDSATKTRTEIELPLGPGPDVADQAVRWLTALHYRPVAVVTKTRQVYHLTRDGFAVEVCLDDAGPIGRFVEIEIVADEAAFPHAQRLVLHLAGELGLTNQERRSYLGMTLEAQAERGRD